MFPAELIPDGHVAGPHHFYIGILIAFLVMLVLWDDNPLHEPLFTTFSSLAALFSFLFVWPFYPFLGALGALVFTTAAVFFAIGHPEWDHYSSRSQAVTIIALLIAFDDVLSHAFGVWTPFDALGKVLLGG